MPQIPVDTSLDLTTIGAIETIARHMARLNLIGYRYNYPGMSDADWHQACRRAYQLSREASVRQVDVDEALKHLSARNQG